MPARDNRCIDIDWDELRAAAGLAGRDGEVPGQRGSGWGAPLSEARREVQRLRDRLSWRPWWPAPCDPATPCW